MLSIQPDFLQVPLDGLADHVMLPPQIKSIGPLTPKKPHALPDELATFVEESSGLLVVSFGTWCEPTLTGQAVLAQAMRTVLPAGHRVLWKLNTTNTDLLAAAEKHADPKTWKFVQWMPQNDLLAHPKVKLMVSHGGFHTSNEAAFHGVPLLLVPFMGDQPTNSALMVRRGMALEVDKNILDTPAGLGEVQAKLTSILTDPSYQAKAKQISKVFRQLNGTKQAADWVEYAYNTDGARHLVWDEWYQLNWLERHSVDVMLFFSAALSTVVALLLVALTWLLNKCTGWGISYSSSVRGAFLLVPVVFIGAIQRYFC